ncbi:hypothetical protein ACSQ67_019701 [Phaseolus vulgaris]
MSSVVVLCFHLQFEHHFSLGSQNLVSQPLSLTKLGGEEEVVYHGRQVPSIGGCVEGNCRFGNRSETLYVSLSLFHAENIPVEEVFENLRCSKEGLSSEAAEERLVIFGHNKLEEKKERKFLKFLGFMWNPLSWVMEAAAIMAIALANGGGKPPDWQDFVGIITLLVINSTISFIEENNAGNAAAALMARLAPKAKVLRDGRWSEQDAAVLVPGDIVSIKLGDIIPADSRLLEGDPLKIDQSALTGESLPVSKGPGDGVYSGSTCKQGEIEAVVIATGVHTFFGKAAHLVDTTNQVGHFQKARLGIREVHFLPFNPTDKRTALTYIDRDGKMHRVSKGAPEQAARIAYTKGSCRISFETEGD